uniref:Uncharacterized protein n=1 Tax=Cacopsylla melanoneura TaxID=428564 RepID=A0A8D8Z3W1_9HEMI
MLKVDVAVSITNTKALCGALNIIDKVKHTQSPPSFKSLLSVKKKIKNAGAIVTKADKSNTLVIMDKSKYDEKINAFLDEESVEKLKKDPTTDLNKLVREALQNDNSLFQQAIKFYNMNSFAPALYGLLKVHKACTSVDIPGTPIRPVVWQWKCLL